MAAATVGAKLTIVQITCAMAVATTRSGRLHFLQRASVTVVTRHINVRAFQSETGLQLVVEGPLIPADRVVAGSTLIVEIAAMRILILMAGNTCGIRFPKGLRLMAVVAFCFPMLPEQWKRAEVVIEEHRVLPADFGMAGFTLSSKGLLVYIVLEMARVTACFQRYFEYRINVAVVTSWLKMTTYQGISRIAIVIEAWFRPGAAAVTAIALLTSMSIMLVIF